MNDTTMRLLRLQGQGYPCSQMMMIMALEEQGQENRELVRAMAGLAKGGGACRGTCGALSAGACILALYAAKGGDDEQEMERYPLMLANLDEWFREQTARYGGSLCHQITEGKEGTPEITLRCGQLIAETYDHVMVLLQENGIDPALPKEDQ